MFHMESTEPKEFDKSKLFGFIRNLPGKALSYFAVEPSLNSINMIPNN